MNSMICATLVWWAVSNSPQDHKTRAWSVTDGPPIGKLGAHLGEYLTIEGSRNDGAKTTNQSLMVDTVNGRRLAHPIPIRVENLELPEGKRIVIKGYENGTMIGTPLAFELAAKEEGREPGIPSQYAWQWHSHFVALRVIEPKELQPKELQPKESRRR